VPCAAFTGPTPSRHMIPPPVGAWLCPVRQDGAIVEEAAARGEDVVPARAAGSEDRRLESLGRRID
jgi:hypothetical protein